MAVPRTLVNTAFSHRSNGLPVVTPDTDNGQTLDITAEAATSDALIGGVWFLCNSVPCLIALGVDPTASTGATNLPLFGPASVPMLIPHGWKVSVIKQGSGDDGMLWLVPTERG